MNRMLGNNFFFAVLAAIATASLCACGGGGHSSAMPQPVPSSSTAPTYTGPLAAATFTITIPVPSKSVAAARRASYISASTQSIKIVLNSAPVGYVQPGTTNVTLGSGNCPGAGPWTCTIPVNLPPGSDNITVSAYDGTGGTGNLLSQQTKTFPSVVVGQANALSIVLDAQVGAAGCPTPSIAMTSPASPNQLQCGTPAAGNVAGTFYFSGTSGILFSLSVKDAAGNAIAPTVPGAPVIGASTTGSIVASTTPSSNPQQVTLTPNGTVGTGTFTVTASGTSPGTDGITQRAATVNIQEDAQTGNAACPTPSIVVSLPGAGASGSACSGASAGTITLSGTSALVFPITLKDGSGNAISPGTGAPTLSVSGGGSVAGATAQQNPFSITITPTGTAGNDTITVTATSAHPGDGVITRTLTFNIAVVPTLVAIGDCGSTAGTCEVDLYAYTTGGTIAASAYGQITNSVFGATHGVTQLGFDSSNQLYVFDAPGNSVLEFPNSQLHQTGGQTPTTISGAGSGIVNGGGPLPPFYNDFNVAPDGYFDLAIDAATPSRENLVAFSSAATSYTLGYRGTGGAGSWYGFTSAILSSSGTTFGYAVGLANDGGQASKVAVILPGGSNLCDNASGALNTACTPSFKTDLTDNTGQAYSMTFDPIHQQLFVGKPESPYSILFYTYSGGFGAASTLSGSGPSNCTSAYKAIVAARDGSIAAFCDGSSADWLYVWNAARTRQTVWDTHSFATAIEAVHWTPDGLIMVATGSTITIYDPTTAAVKGTKTAPTANVNDITFTN